MVRCHTGCADCGCLADCVDTLHGDAGHDTTILCGRATVRSGLTPSAVLIAEGRAAAPVTMNTTLFLRAQNVRSESEYKRQAMAAGRVMYHAHVGLSTWDATRDALTEIATKLADAGYSVDRFGLALDRAMGAHEAERESMAKETGPRLDALDWHELGEVVPIQPHLGDHMIGFPAGFENTVRALAAGVTTIGNVGQYSAFDLVGGSDEYVVTEQTVRALSAMAALRNKGALAHSNLDDGTGTQASHFGAYVGWAALERYVVEDLIGARLAHCYGNTIQQADTRIALHFALDELQGRNSIGSMVYGNTVDHRAGAIEANRSAVIAQLRCDIAAQIRRPTGHAVNPVPLTEAERIPSASEIVDVQLLARSVEREVRADPLLFDWSRLERLGVGLADYGMAFCRSALHVFESDGVDVRDAAQVLLAMRRASMPALEREANCVPPDEIAELVPWKATQVQRLSAQLRANAPRLNGVRVVLAVLEVHDLIRDALVRVLPEAGAEVILLGAGSSIEGVARAAVQEDADAIVLGVYNGNALALGRQLTVAARALGWDGRIFMGGLLNQDEGDGLPVDARPALTGMGVRCMDRVEDLLIELALQH